MKGISHLSFVTCTEFRHFDKLSASLRGNRAKSRFNYREREQRLVEKPLAEPLQELYLSFVICLSFSPASSFPLSLKLRSILEIEV
ncbi:MAG: hypothetical protein V7K26_05985 [Nostoc sp.]|uniref:hypothetical protein n=1 Tax=Nostoc sp. TaxID=1180 RepID=UPI002FF401E2